MLLELDARRRALADEADELAARAEAAAREADEAAAAAAGGRGGVRRGRPSARRRPRRRAARAPRRGRRRRSPASTARAAGDVARVEAPLERAACGSSDRRSRELGDELRRLAALEAEARRDAAEAGRRAAEAEVVVARLGGAPVAVGVAGARDRERARGRRRGGARPRRRRPPRVRVAAADAARAADAALVERAPRRSRLDVDLLRRLVGAATDARRVARARLGARGTLRGSGAGARRRRRGARVGARRRAAPARRGGGRAAPGGRRGDRAGDRGRGRARAAGRRGGRGEATARRGARRRRGRAGARAPTTSGRSTATSSPRASTRLEARREALGKVNPLAKEEYEAEKERSRSSRPSARISRRRSHELAALRDELTETVNRRFDETFAAVAANFEEVAATLFPGGEGRLRLVEPADEDGDAAEPGVEVELRPAGKKITRLSLLSGGEKALGAISFLFALFLAKPCPFYLLDEVEAALDDTNIARFVELLRRYADRAQFVVITHQKRTMEAADVLYGVTMGGDGISQIVSRRLPREGHAAVSA